MSAAVDILIVQLRRLLGCNSGIGDDGLFDPHTFDVLSDATHASPVIILCLISIYFRKWTYIAASTSIRTALRQGFKHNNMNPRREVYHPGEETTTGHTMSSMSYDVGKNRNKENSMEAHTGCLLLGKSGERRGEDTCQIEDLQPVNLYGAEPQDVFRSVFTWSYGSHVGTECSSTYRIAPVESIDRPSLNNGWMEKVVRKAYDELLAERGQSVSFGTTSIDHHPVYPTGNLRSSYVSSSELSTSACHEPSEGYEVAMESSSSVFIGRYDGATPSSDGTASVDELVAVEPITRAACQFCRRRKPRRKQDDALNRRNRTKAVQNREVGGPDGIRLALSYDVHVVVSQHHEVLVCTSDSDGSEQHCTATFPAVQAPDWYKRKLTALPHTLSRALIQQADNHSEFIGGSQYLEPTSNLNTRGGGAQYPIGASRNVGSEVYPTREFGHGDCRLVGWEPTISEAVHTVLADGPRATELCGVVGSGALVCVSYHNKAVNEVGDVEGEGESPLGNNITSSLSLAIVSYNSSPAIASHSLSIVNLGFFDIISCGVSTNAVEYNAKSDIPMLDRPITAVAANSCRPSRMKGKTILYYRKAAVCKKRTRSFLENGETLRDAVKVPELPLPFDGASHAGVDRSDDAISAMLGIYHRAAALLGGAILSPVRNTRQLTKYNADDISVVAILWECMGCKRIWQVWRHIDVYLGVDAIWRKGIHGGGVALAVVVLIAALASMASCMHGGLCHMMHSRSYVRRCVVHPGVMPIVAVSSKEAAVAWVDMLTEKHAEGLLKAMSFIEASNGEELVCQRWPDFIGMRDDTLLEYGYPRWWQRCPNDLDRLTNWAYFTNNESRVSTGNLDSPFVFVYKSISPDEDFPGRHLEEVVIRIQGFVETSALSRVGNWNGVGPPTGRTEQTLRIGCGPFPRVFFDQDVLVSRSNGRVYRQHDETRQHTISEERSKTTSGYSSVEDDDSSSDGLVADWGDGERLSFGVRHRNGELRQATYESINIRDFVEVHATVDVRLTEAATGMPRVMFVLRPTSIVRLCKAANLPKLTASHVGLVSPRQSRYFIKPEQAPDIRI
ncbi:hypothetical protein BV25DRAFT_1838600 [Artomyces pyxidatus]|uniref:Uncharacterized protein n=1 Tax=Artomyces pyxidatus TaxID=48021 RepID=A0ACB8SZZ3_9AGAM|nr:hypothetical protein BV25DRAFT_1838600 [Artomyces pyxidatus]